MGDLVMRISVFIQRGLICQRCGIQIDGEISGHPRSCPACLDLDAQQSANSSGGTSVVPQRIMAARP